MLDVQGAAEWQISQRPQPREILVTMKSHLAYGSVLPDCYSDRHKAPLTNILMNSPPYSRATWCHEFISHYLHLRHAVLAKLTGF